MNMGSRKYAVNSYKSGAASEIDGASPHRLIQMLYEGGLQKIAVAKGAIQRNEIATKGENISRAIAILGGLRSSLDLSQGDIAVNLDNLYEYMERRLLEANIKNDEEILDEVSSLLRDVKSAWDAISV
ncbi:MAG: flagellar export chaperone FliS [Methylicorpusculum sp.]|uniref:flagellar export chaperone FliS n=1 Tax=Methylicorpusculum sp. TaxID=2713644 RepID=UPI00271C2639|nr:flagellar export chaperone FliS [Methylicorpusculum sp.]MDO8845565.1 flagellar export chaperone FliS [Methylicorpusculum sp.]MDO8938940.1 flagellar export chaperone FliS [Methylicorpusculum sp.]MDP2179322.1 flagellar export chaperone FliS [Methylicorpusculum sp.]MDP2200516.1 flagellar export chaperone FliS [Methylicorpusculum sp.]MDP3530104.1 flagellar export chaperone FliS [Methylicorpusculum sp.]